MENLNLYEIRKKSFRDLSGGQKQRVLIARAMCSNEEMLILDEPTNGLDPNIRMQIYKTLAHLNEKHGFTVVMVSHDIDKALSYCTKVIEMKQGKIIFDDIPSRYIHEEGKKWY